MAQYTEFKTDGIWQHFLREKQGQSAKCKLCNTVLKTVEGSTKGLHEHLKRVHDVGLETENCRRYCRYCGEFLILVV